MNNKVTLHKGTRTYAKPRCAALNDNLNQCQNKGTEAVVYHGEHELYGHDGRVDTVVVYFCKSCLKKQNA